MLSILNFLFVFEIVVWVEEVLNSVVQGVYFLVDCFVQIVGLVVECLFGGVDSVVVVLQSGIEDISELQEYWMENCCCYVCEYLFVLIGMVVVVGMLLNCLMMC